MTPIRNLCFALVPLLAVLLGLADSARAGDISLELDAGFGFSVKNDGASIERLRVDEASGNISRNGALFVHTTGTSNTFVGEGAGNTSTSGTGGNAAFGENALTSNTTGFRNSAFGESALSSNTAGFRNSAFGQNALGDNTTGDNNSAFGYEALRSNTGGNRNSAFGRRALKYNITGGYNSAFGHDALGLNTTGSENSAFGRKALYRNDTGLYNSAFGHNALRESTTGYDNSAFGDNALRDNSKGARNVAVGKWAGRNQTTGDDNIYLANEGTAAESGKIKIGSSVHTETFIEGIRGNVATGGVAVLIDSSNELHTVVSSARFKEDVQEMGESSEVLMALRPVTFRYREDLAGESDAREYGLIAEEVAELAPDLVAFDEQGRPYTVRYHLLAPMLLNEVQKQQSVIAEQRSVIAALAGRLAQVERALAPVSDGASR